MGGAFRYTSITNLLLGQNVEFINVFTFLNDKLLNIDVDENNNYYSSIDGVLFNKDKTTLIRYPKARTEENYVIPDGVIKIGENAFSDTLLKSIIVPESVIEIERHILIGSTITHIYFRLSYNHGLYKSWDSNWRFNYENQPYSIWNYKD